MKTVVLTYLAGTVASMAGTVASQWSSAASGSWLSAANWRNTPAVNAWPANGTVSTGLQTYAVRIDAAGAPYSIALDSTLTVDEVVMAAADATVQHSFSEFRATGGIRLDAGIWQMQGATLRNTMIHQNGGTLRFGNAMNRLDGCTLQGSLTVPGTSGQVLLRNGTSFSGDADLAGNYSVLGIEGTQTIEGQRTIRLGGLGSVLSAEGAGAVLTLGEGLTVRGRGVIDSGRLIQASAGAGVVNRGTIIGDTAGAVLAIQPDAFVNLGVVEAAGGGIVVSVPQWTNASGGVLRARGGTLRLEGAWRNEGRLEASDAVVQLAGAFSSEAMGLSRWVRSGGSVEIAGSWDNSGTETALSAASGDLLMRGGTIKGGVIRQEGGRLLPTSELGVLDGVRLVGELRFDRTSDRLRLVNGADCTGDVKMTANHALLSLSSGTVGGGRALHLEGQNCTLSLDGQEPTVVFGSGLMVRGRGTIRAGGLPGTSGGRLDNTGTIRGDLAGQTLVVDVPVFTNASGGTVDARNGGVVLIRSPRMVNEGTLSASGARLRIEGAWVNRGRMELNEAMLELASAFTTADLGLAGWTRTGGVVEVSGHWNNADSSIDLNGRTGDFTLRGGTISGGTVTQSTGGRLSFHSSGGTLVGVAVGGDLLLDKVADRVLLSGGSTFSGDATLTASHAVLGIEGVHELSGARTIALTGAGATLTVEGRDGRLTLGADAVLRGRGLLKSGSFVASTNGELLNRGRIAADVAGQTLSVELPRFTNEGIAEARAGGILQLSSPRWANHGTIRADGAELIFQDEWTNHGRVELQNSVLRLQGSFTTAGMGLLGWSRSGGTVELSGSLDNSGAVLSIPAGAGDLLLRNGTITGGVVEPGAGRLVFTSAGGRLRQLEWRGDLMLDGAAAEVIMEAASFTGNARISGSGARISMMGSSRLDGVKTVHLDAPLATLSIEGQNASLIIEDGVLVRGRGHLSRAQVTTSPGARVVNRGVIRADVPGQALRILTDLTQEGTLEAIGSTLELPAGFEQQAGLLRLAGGVIACQGGAVSTPLMVRGGAFEGHGEVLPASAQKPLTLTMAAGTLRPRRGGSGLAVRGDLLLGSAAVLAFELGGRVPGAGYSTLMEAGDQTLALGGNLTVNLEAGFRPAPGTSDVFTVLTSNHPLAGAFANVAPGGRLATLDGGGSFVVHYGPSSPWGASSVVLTDFRTTGGYAAWVAGYGLGGMAAEAGADPDGDGMANVVEYAFGTTPDAADSSAWLPTPRVGEDGSIALCFSLPLELPADLVCSVEASDDLAAWQSIAACSGGAWSGRVTTESRAGRSLVRVSESGSGVRRFLRLAVRLITGPGGA